MSNFRHNRKHYGKSKVYNDNESNSNPPPHKRQRRGVSVFQRQLYKRKMWVQEYEAGKDQKRRDKRKVMRGYYRALKELDREHKQIFGKSISTRTRRMAKKTGDYSNYQNHKNLKFKSKDVWHELKKPSYQHKYRNSNWEFMDTNTNNTQTYKANKSYRGNGVINLGHNIIINRNDEHIFGNTQSNKDRQSKSNMKQSKFERGRFVNSYQRAMREGREVRKEREQTRNDRELRQKERKKALDKFERERNRRKKILGMKNRQGQPNLNAQIGLLLDKIKHNQKGGKVNREPQFKNNDVHHFSDENNSEVDVNDFLAD